MVTAISQLRVRNGQEEEVRSALLHRPRGVESAPGFCGLDVLVDASDASVFWLLTRWMDEESLRDWNRSAVPDHFTQVTLGTRIEDLAGTQTLTEAVEGQTAALSRWLTDSDAVLALLLAPDGTIRARNQCGHRMFPPDPAKAPGSTIWDYLAYCDVQQLRERMSDSSRRSYGSMLLNLPNERQVPITLEVALVACSGAILLLGTQEHRHDADFQNENLKLTNDLSVMIREADRKNRELKEANETVARLASTDALTGLANRRTLREALQREIARAQRLGEHVSVVICDLDHFKSINDRYGHITGDHVLVSAATVFKNQLRPYDLAARYGGEEFVLLLPATSTDGAIVVAERMRSKIAEIKLPDCPQQITVSIGVATWIAGEAPEQLVARADAALYIAKSAGRNRVETASAVPV